VIGVTVRIAIVDGTGPDSGADYTKAMAKSFCRALANSVGPGRAFYQRGPTAAGLQVMREGLEAFKWLRREHDKVGDAKLMLAGYSRGGSAAILAAEMLEQAKLPVHGLFLFDPVARHVFRGGEVIPGNVKFSRTALRDQSWSFVMKYEGTISDHSKLGATSNPTRPSFGNTGLSWRGTGDHRVTTFTGSHGALGGVGWAFMTEDRSCQPTVSAWMEREMARCGLVAKLGDGQLDPTPPLKAGRTSKFMGQAFDAMMIANSKIDRFTSGHRF
jgi:hypothetical protein